MSSIETPGEYCFGFIAIVDFGDRGCCGGLLVLDRTGRPIEFHCTAPVVADKIQKILYGRNLRHFVHIEQISAALIEKCQLSVDLWLVDDPELLSYDEPIDAPIIALIQPDACETSCHPTLGDGQNNFAVHETTFQTQSSESLLEVIRKFEPSAYIFEPFGRIREALVEANAACAA